MSRSSGGAKPLSGGSSLTARSLPGLDDIIINTITTGTGSAFNNVVITGGIIDGVVIGENLSGPGYFSSLQVGKPDGTGGQVCFYGNTVGDYACWINSTGTWDIGGDLAVRDISQLGNLRISVNTLSSTNTNGNINIASNGTGIVNITGNGLVQTTTNGNITLNTTNGSYTLNSNTLSTNTALNYRSSTTDGSINFTTGLTPIIYPITFITTGSSPTITTSTAHNLTVGDKVTLSETNSTPTINNTYVVQTVPTTTTFTVSADSVITGVGTSGSLVKRNDINLNALDSVFIPQDTPLSFGDDSVYLIGDSMLDLNLYSGNDINFIPTNNVNIPADKLLTFGDDVKNITTDGTDLILNTDNRVVVNGDFTVNGEMTYIKTTVTALDDPVITLGGTEAPTTPDIKDRGVEIRYHNGTTDKIGYFGKQTNTGCFTWIPDATNTNEVFTGSPGCVQFGSASVTSLNLNGGSITNSGTLNTCNIYCSSDMNITADSSITLTSPQLLLNGTNTTITDSVFEVGTTSLSDTQDKGFVFNYYDGSSKLGFIGWDSNTDCFKFLKDVTVANNEVTSGTAGDMCLGNTTVNNLTVTGSFIGGSVPERITVTGGGSSSPTNNAVITYITVTSSGIATGTLPAATIDGFEKKIFLVSTVSGGTYELSCPLGRLVDPGSGTSDAKTLKFENRGQSVHLAWDSVENAYFVVNSGVCVS